jgi:cell division protein FtsL
VQKWHCRLNYGITVGLIIVVLLNFWNGYEERRLNQRYEKLIEQRETLNGEFEEIIRDFQKMRDQLQDRFDFEVSKG